MKNDVGKRDAKEVIEKQVVGNKKQKIVDDDMDQGAEKNNFETETQNNSDINASSWFEEAKNKVDSDPGVVPALTDSMKKGKRDAKEVIEKQVVENKTQKIVDGDMERGAEENNFETDTQNNSEENASSRSEEEKNKVGSDSAVVAAATNSMKKGKSDAKEVIEKEVVDNKKQKIVNGDMEQGAEEKNFEMENQNNSEENASSRSEEEKSKVKFSIAINSATTKDAKRSSSSNESGKEDGYDNCKEADQHSETPNKSPQTPITSHATGSKIVLMDNLSFSIKEADVRTFFKNVGEIVEVHFEMKEDYFTGRGHVEFTTAEAAQEAHKLNDELLLDQPVRLNLETERVEHLTTTHTTGSKTLYLGNLSFSIEEDDVRDFFKDVGEIAEIRFAIRDDRFLGYGHIEFKTVEAAQEALKLNNEVILDRPVKLDLARLRGARTPGSSSSMEKFNQKGGQAYGKTIFIRGFNPSEGFDNIRSALEKHFGKCGEISRMSIPKDYESGAPKGVAFIDFAESNGFSQALGLNGSEVGGCRITVEEAKSQRGDGREGCGYGGSRGFGGGWSGSGSGSGSGSVSSWHRESSHGGGGWRSRGSGPISSWHRDSVSGGGWRGESGSGGGWGSESGSSRDVGIESGSGRRVGRESGFGRGGSGGGWGRGDGSSGGWGRGRGWGGGRIGSSGGGFVSGWSRESRSGGSGFSSNRVGRFSGSRS